VPDPELAGRPARGPRAPLSRETEEFLSFLAVERGRAANTLAAYRRDLSAYEAFLAEAGRNPADADEAVLSAYRAHLAASGRLPSTVARALSAVRGLHRFLAEEGLAESDPARDLALPRVPDGLPKPLGEGEVARLLDRLPTEGPVALRDRALLEVLYATGVRVSEAVGLSLADLVLEEGVMRVLGKGGKERLVPVGRTAAAALSAWLGPRGRPLLAPRRWARRSDAEAVFLNVRGRRLTRQGVFEIVRRHGRRAGLGDRLTPHVLRHSCATHMLDHGADIRVVQELLGHASVTTTQVYTRVSMSTLRAAYLAAHPRARLGAGRSRPEEGRTRSRPSSRRGLDPGEAEVR
jgi:integrase/recombinase XerD